MTGRSEELLGEAGRGADFPLARHWELGGIGHSILSIENMMEAAKMPGRGQKRHEGLTRPEYSIIF